MEAGTRHEGADYNWPWVCFVKRTMALIIAFSTLLLPVLTYASSRCVEIFDVSVKYSDSVFSAVKNSTVKDLSAKIPSQEDYLKNYLALNMAYPQHRSTISLGVTAFYFSRGMAFEMIYKPLSESQANSVYSAMIRAHSTVGVTMSIPFEDSQFALASFTMTLPFRIERTEIWLDTYFGGHKSDVGKEKIRVYSSTISSALRSPEAREMSRRFREGLRVVGNLSNSEAISREQISDQIRDLVIQKLLEAHPELSESPPTAAPLASSKTLAELLYDAME